MSGGEEKPGVCLGLLCGLPASGKSTLAGQIQDHVAKTLSGQFCVFVLHYDKLIPAQLEQQLIAQTAEQGGSLWKSTRNQIVACVSCLLNVLINAQNPIAELINLCENHNDLSTQSEHISEAAIPSSHFEKPSCVDLALWERFVSLIRNLLKKMAFCGQGCEGLSCSWLVLVDDNMHYSSMRYEYCQLARKYEVGLCVIHISCPVEEALKRNGGRPEGSVEDHVITLMQQRMEAPDSDKRPWEKYSATVNGMTTIDLQPILQLVQEATMDPQRPLPEEDTEVKVISRYICSTNTIHQADQILRRCVSLHMAEAKGAGLGSGELKTVSAELTKVRTAILSDMRQGEVTLPFQPDETSVSNASKDADSPLFQFVQNLFLSRTRCS